jgi:hypothetical protein
MVVKRVQSWHQTEYAQGYTPAAPALRIQIAGPDAGDWIEADDAFIDTGADASIIPQDLLRQIAAVEWDQAWLRSQWGEPRLIYRYEVDLQIVDRVFPGIVVVADDIGDEVILGRDFVNQVRLLLDGPQLVLELLD